MRRSLREGCWGGGVWRSKYLAAASVKRPPPPVTALPARRDALTRHEPVTGARRRSMKRSRRGGRSSNRFTDGLTAFVVVFTLSRKAAPACRRRRRPRRRQLRRAALPLHLGLQRRRRYDGRRRGPAAQPALTGGLTTGTVHVWATNVNFSNPADHFVRAAGLNAYCHRRRRLADPAQHHRRQPHDTVQRLGRRPGHRPPAHPGEGHEGHSSDGREVCAVGIGGAMASPARPPHPRAQSRPLGTVSRPA